MDIPKTAREMLDLIDQFLVSPPIPFSGSDPFGPTEQKALWDVLSALRGPDDMKDAVKHVTTARIRKAAFPLCANKAGEHLVSTQSTDKQGKSIVVASCFHIGAEFAIPAAPEEVDLNGGYGNSTHFGAHVQFAASRLKLKCI
jgi:hypothetical protein